MEIIESGQIAENLDLLKSMGFNLEYKLTVMCNFYTEEYLYYNDYYIRHENLENLVQNHYFKETLDLYGIDNKTFHGENFEIGSCENLKIDAKKLYIYDYIKNITLLNPTYVSSDVSLKQILNPEMVFKSVHIPKNIENFPNLKIIKNGENCKLANFVNIDGKLVHESFVELYKSGFNPIEWARNKKIKSAN